MTTITGASARDSMLRSSTQILKSLLTETSPEEPGRIPTLTAPGFDEGQSFLSSLARQIMDLRAGKDSAVSRAPASSVSPAQTDAAARGRTLTIERGDIGKVYGTTGDDQVSLKGNRIDYVSAGAGNDSIRVTATGSPSAKPGLAALDSGSVTRIHGGAGDDRITVDAEQLADTVYGGDGDDVLEVTASYATEIAGGNGNDKVTVNAYVVEHVDGNAGNDEISITAKVDQSLDQILKDTTRSGTVTDVTGGFGDDGITIKADGGIRQIDAGRGNDRITAKSGDYIADVFAGSGDDKVTLSADWSIWGVDLGSGKDQLQLEAAQIRNIEGGYGDDDMSLTGHLIMDVNGGAGDDTITITGNPSPRGFGEVYGVLGGAGNDTITITAESMGDIAGGKGNDNFVLHARDSKGAIGLSFAEGDGHDTITTTNDLQIWRYSADGTKELGLKDATLTKTGADTWDLTFKGSRDRITLVHKEPGMASGTHVPVIDGNTIRWKPDPSYKTPVA